MLSNKSGNTIFHHLNPFLAQRFSLCFSENLMAIRTDEQVVTPIPDDFGHMESLLSFFCDHDKGLLLEFPSIAVGAAKHTFPVIVMQTIYRGKNLFETGGKQDCLCGEQIPFLCGDFKRVISMANTSDSHVLDFHRRIFADFLVCNGSELVRFDSVSCQKSMRLLRYGISWLILVKHQNRSPGSPQDKSRI